MGEWQGRLRRWQLVGSLGDRRSVLDVWADPCCSMGESFDATTTAIGMIMNRAVDDELWANGEIVLYDPDGSEAHRMEAKV